jgi:hypothetical protein
MSTTPPRSFAEIQAERIAERQQAPSLAAQQSAFPYHIALILDNEVQQVFHIEEEMASIFMSSPLILQVEAPLAGGPEKGWAYNPQTGQFTAPE